MPTLAAESLEQRALLAVTASITGGDLVIAFDTVGDTAEISSDGTNYAVKGTDFTPQQFDIAKVTGIISVADKGNQAGQTFTVLSGTALANPLQVNANIETTSLLGGISATKAGTVSIGSGTISLANDISTAATNANVTLSGATTLTKAVSITTGAGAGNILFLSTLDGTTAGSENLTLTAGTGNVTFTGAVGGSTRLGEITLASAANVTANAVTAASLTQTDGTVTTALNGAVNTNAAAGVSLSTKGTIAIAAAGDITTTNGPVFLKANNGITTAGDVTTSGKNVTFGLATTLSGPVEVKTGSGAGNILFSSTLDGTTDGGENLTLTAGTGDVTFTGAVGGTTRLGAITIASAASVTADAVTAASLTQTDGTVTTATTALNGAVNTNAAAGVSLSTKGTIAIAAAGDITTTNGPVFLKANNGITTAGDVTTTNDDVTFVSKTTLSGPVKVDTVDTGAGAGSITFSSTLDGTTDGTEDLTLTAGTGDVTFTGAVGGTTRLGAITIAKAANVTANAVTAASLTQTDGTVTTATTALNGAVNTNAAAGVSLKGTNLAVNAGITTTNGGKVTFNQSGTIAIAAAGDISADGAVSLTAGDGITTAGDVTTTNDDVTFVSKTTLSGPVKVDTDAGAGNILFSSTLDGAKQVTLAAGTGAVAFKAAVGSTTPLAGITLTSARSTKADFSIKLAKSADSSQDGLTVAAGVNNVTMTAAGSSITGFAGNGIAFLGGSTNSQIGGFTVSENSANGMNFAAGSYAGTTITGNTISKNGDFTTHVGNGILVEGSDLMIGGDAPASGNKICKNALNGIEIVGSAAVKNAILSNSIFLNGQGVTAVVNGDTTLLGEGIKLSSGGNGSQVAPQIFDVVRNAAAGKIYVQVNVPAAGNYLVQLFANKAADEQGIFPADTKGFQGRRFVGANPSGTPVVGNTLTPIEVDPSLVSLVAAGDWITATATLLETVPLPDDKTTTIPTTTSEFSAAVQAGNVQPLGAGGDGQATWLSAPAVPGQLINRYANELAYKAVNANTIEIQAAGQMSLPQLTIYTNRNVRNQVVNPRGGSLVNTEVTLAPTGGTNDFRKVTGVSRNGNTAMRLTLSGDPLTPQTTGFLVLGTPALPAARLYDAANPAGGPIITVGPATKAASSSHYDMTTALTDTKMAGLPGKGPVTNAQALAFVSRFQGGMRVASADVNGDGFVDLVTAPGNAGAGFAGNVFGDAPRIITIYNGDPSPSRTWHSSSINLSGESSLASYTGGFQVSLANLRPENTGSGNAIAELVVASSNQVFVYELNVKARGEKPEIIPVTAVPPITTTGTVTGLAAGSFTDTSTVAPLADIVVATTTATPAQVTKWLSSADQSLAKQRTSSVTVYSATNNFAPSSTFTLADNLYNGSPFILDPVTKQPVGRLQNVFIGGASLAVADIDNAPDQRPELILGAQFMGMGNFRVLANDVVSKGTQTDVDVALSANARFGRAPRGLATRKDGKEVWQPTGGPDFFTTDLSAASENLIVNPPDGLPVASTGLGFNAPLSVAAAQINGDFKSRVFAALGATNGTPGRVRAFTWLGAGEWKGEAVLDVESGVVTQKARLPRGSGLRLG